MDIPRASVGYLFAAELFPQQVHLIAALYYARSKRPDEHHQRPQAFVARTALCQVSSNGEGFRVVQTVELKQLKVVVGRMLIAGHL
jgi:hypothetical protein